MNKVEMESSIKADLYRYKADVSSRAFLSNLLRNPGFRYMWLFRKCQFYKSKNPLIFFSIEFY